MIHFPQRVRRSLTRFLPAAAAAALILLPFPAAVSGEPVSKEIPDDAGMVFRIDLAKFRKSVWNSRLEKSSAGPALTDFRRQLSSSSAKNFPGRTFLGYGKGGLEGFVSEGLFRPEDLVKFAGNPKSGLKKLAGPPDTYRFEYGSSTMADGRKDFLIRASAPDVIAGRSAASEKISRTGKAPVLKYFLRTSEKKMFAFAVIRSAVRQNGSAESWNAEIDRRSLEAVSGFVDFTGRDGGGVTAELDFYCGSETAARTFAQEIRQGFFLLLALIDDPSIDPGRLLGCVRTGASKRIAFLKISVDEELASRLFAMFSNVLEQHVLPADAAPAELPRAAGGTGPAK